MEEDLVGNAHATRMKEENMRWSGRKSQGPIGLDIGSRYIKAVQVSRAGRSVNVTAAMAIPRFKDGGPLEHEEASRLAEVLYRQGFEGRRVVLAAPGESLLVGTLSVPPKQSGAPVDQIARMELARMHKHDPMSFELVHWELPTTGSSGGKGAATSVMAAACPHVETEALLDLFESTGLEVVGLDVSWLALARACTPMFAPPAEDKKTAETQAKTVAILDIGWRTARVIVLRNDVIIFERVLTEGGLCKLRDTLKNQLQLDDNATDFLLRDVGCSPPQRDASESDRRVADRRASDRRASDQQASADDDAFKEPRRLITVHFAALLEELKVSLSYAVQQFRGEGIDKLVLCGGGGAIPGLPQQLHEAFQFDVISADVAQLATCPHGLERFCGSTVLTAALGLALYEE